MVIFVIYVFGSVSSFVNCPINLTIDGPGEIIGENPFALFGGVGAVWIKTKQSPGTIRLTAKHQTLGAKTVTFSVKPFRISLI